MEIVSSNRKLGFELIVGIPQGPGLGDGFRVAFLLVGELPQHQPIVPGEGTIHVAAVSGQLRVGLLHVRVIAEGLLEFLDHLGRGSSRAHQRNRRKRFARGGHLRIDPQIIELPLGIVGLLIIAATHDQIATPQRRRERVGGAEGGFCARGDFSVHANHRSCPVEGNLQIGPLARGQRGCGEGMTLAGDGPGKGQCPLGVHRQHKAVLAIAATIQQRLRRVACGEFDPHGHENFPHVHDVGGEFGILIFAVEDDGAAPARGVEAGRANEVAIEIHLPVVGVISVQTNGCDLPLEQILQQDRFGL